MDLEVTFMPTGKKASVRKGTTLLDASRRAKEPIRVRCDGKASCLMCKVKVEDQSGLEPPNKNEKLKLGSLTNEGTRLACQARVIGSVIAEVPEDPLKAAIRAQLAKQQEDDSLW